MVAMWKWAKMITLLCKSFRLILQRWVYLVLVSDQNADKVQGSLIESVEPTFESISDKSYPSSRPLYFYVKKAHIDVVPGILGYLTEFTSERAWGDDGYLAEKGMIPLAADARKALAASVRALTPMNGKEPLK